MKQQKPEYATGNHTIPYGRQTISNRDIQAVVAALKSDFLTTGPRIEAFEKQLAAYVGGAHAVAVSSGTAALHAAMYAVGIGPGDEVILPSITFAATANAVVYQGGTPVFVDVNPDTLLIDPFKVIRKITPKTRAIIAVDYAGQPCDYLSLRLIAEQHNLYLISDACHSLGAEYRGRRAGSLADLTVFSFHPVKHITTGEGGMVVTHDPSLTDRMRMFRNHGICSDPNRRQQEGTWYYEMVDLGFNYRITDIQCALGSSQLAQLPDFLALRRKIARQYHSAFYLESAVRPLTVSPDVLHAYHLYVVRIDFDQIGKSRRQVFADLQERGIRVNVHYIPVHLHPFYRNRFGTGPGLCPIAEAAYKQILSLPIYPSMQEWETDYCADSLLEILEPRPAVEEKKNPSVFETIHHNQLSVGESHA